jgi:hypothetical protein
MALDWLQAASPVLTAVATRPPSSNTSRAESGFVDVGLSTNGGVWNVSTGKINASGSLGWVLIAGLAALFLWRR